MLTVFAAAAAAGFTLGPVYNLFSACTIPMASTLAITAVTIQTFHTDQTYSPEKMSSGPGRSLELNTVHKNNTAI